MKMLAAISLIALIGLVSFSTTAEAAGRRGSHRVGGYTSHGKGSYYVGGH